MTLEILHGDESLVDLQLSLAAYTEIVMKNLCDTVPKLVYNQLVTKVRQAGLQTTSETAQGVCIQRANQHSLHCSQARHVSTCSTACSVMTCSCSHDVMTGDKLN